MSMFGWVNVVKKAILKRSRFVSRLKFGTLLCILPVTNAYLHTNLVKLHVHNMKIDQDLKRQVVAVEGYILCQSTP